jgi:dihydropteroate synthase
MSDSKTHLFSIGDRQYSTNDTPLVMGILNVTPDSFSDGGKYFDPESALQQAFRMAEEGADLIDVGGESTRPGAGVITPEEEIRRVIPIIDQIKKRINIPVSVDTSKAEVARRALDAGAEVINDISAARSDSQMFFLAASRQTTIILMHMQGDPRNMQDNPTYINCATEVHNFLEERIHRAELEGISPNRILIDPGIGFGKRLQDNFNLLGNLSEFCELAPIVVGPSRKSFIGKTLDLPADQRIMGTAAAVAIAVFNGASILRVHDVAQMKQVIQIANLCKKNNHPVSI